MLVALKAIFVVVSLVLIIGVLMQSSKSEGLSGTISGSAATVFGRKAKGLDKLLAKITTVAAIAFIVLSVVIAAL